MQNTFEDPKFIRSTSNQIKNYKVEDDDNFVLDKMKQITSVTLTLVILNQPAVTAKNIIANPIESSENLYSLSNTTDRSKKIYQPTLTTNYNYPVESKDEKIKETRMMLREIQEPILKFENLVTRFGFFLILLFFVLSLPFFIGYPALVGVFMSLGLVAFIRIRKWERGEDSYE